MQASSEGANEEFTPAALWASLPPHVRQAFLQLTPQDSGAAHAASSHDGSQPRGTVRPRENQQDASERPRQRHREAQAGGERMPTHVDALQRSTAGYLWDQNTPFPGVSQQRQLPFFQGPEEDEEDEEFGRGVDWRAMTPHESQHGVRGAPAQNALSFAAPAPRLPSIAPPASHATSLAPSASRATSVQPTPSQDPYSGTDSAAMWRVVLLKRAKLQQQALARANGEWEPEDEDQEGEMAEFDEALAVATGAPNDDALPDLASIKTTLPNSNEKFARHKVMEAFRMCFRDLAGVRVNQEWMSWDGEDQVDSATRPGKKDWRPDFQRGVKDKTNLTMIQQVASIVFPALKLDDPVQRPMYYHQGCTFKITFHTIVELGKITYQGFKQEYARQQSPEGREKKALENQENLRRQRRKMKAAQRREATPTFKKRYGVDLSSHIHTDWMSDEVSCAEGKTTLDAQAQRAWRRKVGASVYRSAEEAAKAKFFGILQSPWHEKLYGDACRVLSDIHTELQASKRQQGQHTRRIRIKHTSKRVPLTTPYCWQINQDFYEAHKDEESMKFVLRNWNRRTDPSPPGWDELAEKLPVVDDGNDADDEDVDDEDEGDMDD
ncbi:hypothetical protein K488DRAFT_92282 [Vararia minispora EC-137]|uniref:Uncharacterized protein n=1 Tax=Vararia minispora EC-137 TaxID=1314806 RepID=A0ACB8Q4A5_9AGAM|nr:hypothetical protein K488DRAFT_92282 [Vararia minispora EC-137]